LSWSSRSSTSSPGSRQLWGLFGRWSRPHLRPECDRLRCRTAAGFGCDESDWSADRDQAHPPPDSAPRATAVGPVGPSRRTIALTTAHDSIACCIGGVPRIGRRRSRTNASRAERSPDESASRRLPGQCDGALSVLLPVKAIARLDCPAERECRIASSVSDVLRLKPEIGA
jgi:hypothetical protein